MITPDRADRYDENALDRRHLSVATDQTGMVLLSGQLDQCTGLKFATVLDHVVETDRAAGARTALTAASWICGRVVSAAPTPSG